MKRLLGVIVIFGFGVLGGVLVDRLVAIPALQPTEPSVTGVGGIFFKSKDPQRLSAWYRENLGVQDHFEMAGQPHIAQFLWREYFDSNALGYTVWAAFPDTTDYFGPGGQDFMINYRVHDLDGLLRSLKERGIEQMGEIEGTWYGRFAWIVDLEGNRVELWEPTPMSPKAYAAEWERRR